MNGYSYYHLEYDDGEIEDIVKRLIEVVGDLEPQYEAEIKFIIAKYGNMMYSRGVGEGQAFEWAKRE